MQISPRHKQHPLQSWPCLSHFPQDVVVVVTTLPVCINGDLLHAAKGQQGSQMARDNNGAEGYINGRIGHQ